MIFKSLDSCLDRLSLVIWAGFILYMRVIRQNLRSSCKSSPESNFSEYEIDLCQNDYLNSHICMSAITRT